MATTFSEWQQTPEGKEACDLSVFPSLPKKHWPYIINRLGLAYESGVASVTVQEDKPLSPPVENGDTE